MKRKIQESIFFLKNEFRRLKKLDKKNELSTEKKILLRKLASFLEKDKK